MLLEKRMLIGKPMTLVIAKHDSRIGEAMNTYSYEPYVAKFSGGTVGAGFFWTGNAGSRSTGKAFAEQYNRTRHYSSTTRQWITRDPLWPDEHPDGYVSGNPVKWLDPYGLSLQNCMSIQIPVTDKVRLGMQYCVWCFEPRCCDGPGPWAGKCTGLSGFVSLRLKVIKWDDLNQMVRETAESILRIIMGGAFAISQCNNAELACVPRSRTGNVSVCFSACGTAVSFSGCVVLYVSESGSTGLKLSGGVSFGYCGLPGVSISAKVGQTVCE